MQICHVFVPSVANQILTPSMLFLFGSTGFSDDLMYVFSYYKLFKLKVLSHMIKLFSLYKFGCERLNTIKGDEDEDDGDDDEKKECDKRFWT